MCGGGRVEDEGGEEKEVQRVGGTEGDGGR